LVSRSLNPERHAVLAFLSERYPPLEGRSPTCYSPVRHSTQDRSPFRVRLACVRHAASVDSEPGSNSHVKVLVRFETVPARLAPHLSSPSTAIFNKRLVALLFVCLVSTVARVLTSYLPCGSRSARTPTPLADTRRAGCSDSALRPVENVCTFYLVFKEPRLRRPSITQAIRDSQPTFAFASVEPFRGTFRAYDGYPRLSTLFFVTNSGSTNR
jgi:hypothetical protein